MCNMTPGNFENVEGNHSKMGMGGYYMTRLVIMRFLKCWLSQFIQIPDSKVDGDNMGPIWDRQDPGGPHVGPMNLAIWDMIYKG